MMSSNSSKPFTIHSIMQSTLTPVGQTRLNQMLLTWNGFIAGSSVLRAYTNDTSYTPNDIDVCIPIVNKLPAERRTVQRTYLTKFDELMLSEKYRKCANDDGYDDGYAASKYNYIEHVVDRVYNYCPKHDLDDANCANKVQLIFANVDRDTMFRYVDLSFCKIAWNGIKLVHNFAELTRYKVGFVNDGLILNEQRHANRVEKYRERGFQIYATKEEAVQSTLKNVAPEIQTSER
jgi:hypothetical protein